MKLAFYLSRFISRFDTRFDRVDENLRIPESPVPHLLVESYKSPSPEERRKIEDVLSLAREQVTKLQEQLDASSSSSNPRWLQTLRILKETESFIHNHECILSLFRTLPNEILVSIFIACLPDVESEPIYQRKWHTIPSFRLSQVCRQWRGLAIRTPQLWIILGDVVLNPDVAKESRNSYLSFIKKLLKRSANMDLSIFISIFQDYTQMVHPVLAVLIKNKHRWGTLGIYGSFGSVKAICDTDHPGTSPSLSFKRLRKLRLDIARQPSHWETIDISRAPLLIDVSIPHAFHSGVLLPFKQLRIYRETFLHHYVRPTDALFKTLRMGDNLEELETLTDGGLSFSPHKHDNNGAGAVTLNNLKTLTLWIDSVHHSSVDNSAEALLNVLIFPNLETLKLAGFSASYQTSIPISFVQDSFPHVSLRKLHLRHLAFSAGALSKLLLLTPNLEELISDLPPEEDLVQLTAGRSTRTEGTTGLLVPRLKGLVVHLSTHDVTTLLLRKHRRKSILLLGPAIVEGKAKKDGAYFRLVLPDQETAEDVQVNLNMDNYDARDQPIELAAVNLNSDENIALRDRLIFFRRMIRLALSELKLMEEKMLTTKTNKSTLRPVFASDLNHLLLEIEALKLGQGWEIANLYVAWLHLALLSLSKVAGNVIPRENKYMFRERAKRIINKWDSIMLVDLKNRKISWALKGRRSLTYLSQDDVWHNLPQIKDAVYEGMEDNENELKDIRWFDRVFSPL